MTTVADVVDLLHALYPPDTAESWDAVGLAAGDPAAEVSRVLLAVDPVSETVAEAVDCGAQLMITHHPLLLRGVHTVAASTLKGGLVHTLITNGVALLTAHTNADVARPGVSDALAARFGLLDTRPLVAAPEVADGAGHGRVGELPGAVSLRELTRIAADVLPVGTAGVRAAGDPDRSIRTVAVCGGAGDSFLAAAATAGADAYVTADLRHHPVSEHLGDGGPALLDVGHWSSERPWLDDLAERLRTAFGVRPRTVDVVGGRIPDETPGLAATVEVPIEVMVSDRVTDPWSVHAGRPPAVPVDR
ncbi:Nif3-like dinuclear metal center hexameric protein [Fodinicola acaciae]|uniref:Nif3-like dinuclear metal center hexameric protein n=1 Tax=Fodinicola acaciae TaxID=2681555 RepID=UPI0013D0372E|nr:Nif3-like dinuclear metal center hexameric protein [Fodinicola acaciae]